MTRNYAHHLHVTDDDCGRPTSVSAASDHHTETSPLPRRAIVFSDTDNDVSCVNKTLRFAKIIDNRARITEDAAGLDIFHTGDLLDKKEPDPSTVEFWEHLRLRAELKGCRVTILAGNHELEAWQRIKRGTSFGLSAMQLSRIRQFIEGLDLFHLEAGVLLLHGYPTLTFMQTLVDFWETTGKHPNCYNEDVFRKAFRIPREIKQYAYVQGKAGAYNILSDVAQAHRYYKKQGREVADLLKQLGIHTVIHGHRPQHSGIQADYELTRWIPGVRMICNDTQVRERGIGATIILCKPKTIKPEILFINTATNDKKRRKQIRKSLSQLASAPPVRAVEKEEKPAIWIKRPNEAVPISPDVETVVAAELTPVEQPDIPVVEQADPASAEAMPQSPPTTEPEIFESRKMELAEGAAIEEPVPVESEDTTESNLPGHEEGIEASGPLVPEDVSPEEPPEPIGPLVPDDVPPENPPEATTPHVSLLTERLKRFFKRSY